MFNHSCVPNVFPSFDEKSHLLVFRCIRDVNCGEEFCISYTELAAPKKIRKALLCQSYGFDCNCRGCLHGRRIAGEFVVAPPDASDVLVDLDEMLLADKNGIDVADSDVTTRTALQRASELSFEAESETENRLMMEVEAEKLTASVVHPLNLQLYAVRCRVMTSALEVGDNEVARCAAENVVDFLRHVYCEVQHHAMLGLNLITLGDIYEALGIDCKAKNAFEEAIEVLRICYGSDHSYVTLLRDKLTHE